jgi:hypothetical protein
VVLLLRVLACSGPGSIAVRKGLEHNKEHALEQVGDAQAWAGQAHGVVSRIGGDDTVDAEAGVVDEWDEHVEAVRHGGAVTQGRVWRRSIGTCRSLAEVRSGRATVVVESFAIIRL